MAETAPKYVLNGGQLSVVGHDLEEIPAELGERYGNDATQLTLSFNNISTVTNIDKFTGLRELILDNNSLVARQSLPSIPTLETLWVNNNKINNLDRFINEVAEKCPNLTYLSMLRNPCCPNYFVGKDSKAYQQYRYFVIAKLPKLQFLDAAEITPKERHTAKQRSQRVARPAASEYSKKAAALPIDESQALPTEDNLGNHKASFGVTRYLYYGRQSEGNRFIVDESL
eukprot:CAMPEP_0168527146 /NCGR_PEP_ID=MMETSP0405-20121227/12414_1 /TAXON_ID=498012 /ORGANISM="Trichosphaerium sp, Strain Am-I-7 wt" /LENGTH=227 /DNA_ID=CAMNT_0008550173 /DNA_START=46 /DNA_END=729 /DNA_ORIENTATION=+